MSNFIINLQNLIIRFLKIKVSLSLVFIIFILYSVFIWGLAEYNFKVSISNVRIIGIGVGVYWDSNCDNVITFLSWGRVIYSPLSDSGSKIVTIFIRNEGTIPVTLFINTSDWDPPFLSKYVNLNWDYDGMILRSEEATKVNLILSINSSIWYYSDNIKEYKFNIIISTF